MKQDKKIISILLEKINSQEGLIEQQQKDYYALEKRYNKFKDDLLKIARYERQDKDANLLIAVLKQMAVNSLCEFNLIDEKEE